VHFPSTVNPRRDATPDAFPPDARARWLGWQRAHTAALEALQTAQAAYHRLTAEQAFTVDDESARARRRAALARLDELRARLDEIREQQPSWRD
jgi:hypothetical protein